MTQNCICLTVGGDRYSVCFAKLTLLIQYTQYSQLFMEWTMPDHAIVHLHFSSGVTIRH